MLNINKIIFEALGIEEKSIANDTPLKAKKLEPEVAQKRHSSIVPLRPIDSNF